MSRLLIFGAGDIARGNRAETGRGEVSIKVDDDQGGAYVLRAGGTDRFGNPVVADRLVTVSGKKDEKDAKEGKDGKDKKHVAAKAGPGAKLDDAAAAAAIADQIAKLRRPGGPEIETKHSSE